MKKINFKGHSALRQDFTGFMYSHFIEDITEEIEKNIKEIKNLSFFTGFESTKVFLTFKILLY